MAECSAGDEQRTKISPQVVLTKSYIIKDICKYGSFVEEWQYSSTIRTAAAVTTRMACVHAAEWGGGNDKW